MSGLLQINATNARKNFFGLLDQVVNDDLKIVITKEGLNSPILIAKQKTSTKALTEKKQLELVRSTAGSIKTSGYKANEMDLAKKYFVKKYGSSNAK